VTDVVEEVAKGREIVKEIEKGKWPNFIREAKKTRYPVDLYGASLYLKRDLFTTGGYVSVPGAPTGILMRVTSRPDIGESTNVVRVLIPSGNFISSEMMDKFCDFADKYGVGMIHALSTSHNVEIPGIPKERIRDFVVEFREAGLEIGSTGDAFRNTTTCVGSTLCEYANLNTMAMRDTFYDKFNDYAKYPTFPHKMKLKISGCPLDCARSTQKADIGVVGSWEGAPEVDDSGMKKLGNEKIDAIVNSCPTLAISRSNGGISIRGEDCIQCMKCLRKAEGAIRPGKEKKFLIYVGGKLRGKKGPLSSKLLMKVDTEEEVMNTIEKIVEVFTDHAARKERLGDLIFRIGMKGFLDLMEMEPKPLNLKDLRTNVFYPVTEAQRNEISEHFSGGGSND
jgi:sulfite reductase alpha subunit